MTMSSKKMMMVACMMMLAFGISLPSFTEQSATMSITVVDHLPACPACGEKTTKFIRGILHEVGVQNADAVHIRKFSAYDLILGMAHNAYFMIFPGSACYLLVDEDWFVTLPEETKRALIVHEAMHICKGHLKTRKTMIDVAKIMIYGGLITSIITPTLCRKFTSIELNKTQTFLGYIAMLLAYEIVGCAIYRVQEYEADAGAVNFGCVEGIVDYLQQHEKDLKKAQAAAGERGTLARVTAKIFQKLFASHPTPQDRIERLRQLAKQ